MTKQYIHIWNHKGESFSHETEFNISTFERIDIEAQIEELAAENERAEESWSGPVDHYQSGCEGVR